MCVTHYDVSLSGYFDNETFWKFDGANWVQVTSALTHQLPCFAIDASNRLYLAYQDFQTNGSIHTRTKASVGIFAGTSWSTLGSANFSAGTVPDIGMAINPSYMVPCVVFADGANGNKATLMEYK